MASSTPDRIAPRHSRRSFLGTTLATAASLSAPGIAGAAAGAGRGPLRFAQIGCGGKGNSDLDNTVNAGGKLIAMCDVDPGRAKGQFEKRGNVPKYSDFREMLEKHADDLDAVVVSTPDHVHAVAALAAMKRGLHVYVQKPLARTYRECQVLLEAARKYQVVTQMGNQGHAGAGLKLWQEMMDDGAFGEVLELHSWSNRPIWPQGMTEPPAPEEVPDGLDWDSWVGPMAMRPYSKEYVPFKWRGWWDFGAGAMGDMACHNMDPAFWTCQLGLPTMIKAEVSAPATVAFPEWSIVTYQFPATEVCPKGVKFTWYDGKKLPALPPGADPKLNVGGNGCMIVGSKMSALGGSHASPPKPIAIGDEFDQSAISRAERKWSRAQKRLKGDEHHEQWVDACKKGDMKMPGSNFEYAAPMTQALALGMVALRFPGVDLRWDNKAQKFSNHEEANRWLTIDPRDGYDLTL